MDEDEEENLHRWNVPRVEEAAEDEDDAADDEEEGCKHDRALWELVRQLTELSQHEAEKP